MSSRVPGLHESGGRPRYALQQIADRVETVTLPDSEFDESLVLNDLRPVREVREVLECLLDAGFALVDVWVTSEIDFGRHRVTALVRGDEVLYVAHLPAKVLSSDGDRFKNLLYGLLFVFPREARVVVLSHRVDAILPVFDSILKLTNWAQAAFVPWTHLRGPVGPDRLPLLLRVLDLEPESNGTSRVTPLRPPMTVVPPPSSPRRPTADELELVGTNLAEVLAADADPRAAFADFVGRAVPDALVNKGRAQANDNPDTAARQLVKWAAVMGPVVFGRIVALLVEEAPGREAAAVLVDVAAQCGRLPTGRIAELRALVEELSP